MKHVQTISMVLLLFIGLLGCTGASTDGEEIAYISVTDNSQYTKTFHDLHLGVLYDFHFKLTKADKSWVTLWVEGYKNGEKTTPFRLSELSYGLHPDQVTEGPLGFGMIHPQSEHASFFMYSAGGGASIPPHVVENMLNSDGVWATNWGYAIDDKVGLKDGETKVLGVYRQTGNLIRTYDYQNPNDIAKMIKEDIVVLLLKIKVERRNELLHEQP